jgi:carbamoyltransferase
MKDSFTVMGIHDNHNASVSLLRDGRILFLLQEERVNRVKNFNGFPAGAIKHCLDWSGLSLEEIDLFAFGTIHNPPWRDQEALLRYYGQPGAVKFLQDLFRASPLFRMYQARRRKARERFLNGQGIAPRKVRVFDHHLTHAGSALYGSGFDHQDLLIFTLDGGGDGRCAAIFMNDGDGGIRTVASTPEGHSIGNLYSYTTYYLGMTPLEHEYKLMGMAPYCQSRYSAPISARLTRMLDVDGMRFSRRTWFPTSSCLPALEKVYHRERFDNICGGLQEFTEDLVIRWIRNGIEETGIRRVCLSGGVFMNVKLNRRILGLPEVEDLFIVPSCGDESNPIGAAYLAYAEHCREIGAPPRCAPLGDLYLGEEFSEEAIRAEISGKGLDCRREDRVEACIAELLADNRIVARFSGRAEWGARALGNRSILANPSRPENVQRINEAIKMRDFWMPFAATVLDSWEKQYILNPKGIPSPYMILSFETLPQAKDIVAGIHPKDRTIRPQVLTEPFNPGFYRILDQFSRMTGIGGVLNTSFNLHGEPMVYNPADALHTWLSSGLDALVLGNYVITR